MKKLVAMLLAAVLCFALVGCDKRVIELPENTEYVLGVWEPVGSDNTGIEIREDGTCIYNGEEYKWGLLNGEVYMTQLQLFDGRKEIARLNFFNTDYENCFLQMFCNGENGDSGMYVFVPPQIKAVIDDVFIGDWYRSVNDGAPWLTISEDLTLTMNDVSYPCRLLEIVNPGNVIFFSIGVDGLEQGQVYFTLPEEDGYSCLDILANGQTVVQGGMYSAAEVELVELTMDNWSDYFEIKGMVVPEIDEFGELTGACLNYYFSVREEYAGRIVDKDVSIEYQIDTSAMVLGEFEYLMDTDTFTTTTLGDPFPGPSVTVDTRKIQREASDDIQIFWYGSIPGEEMYYNAVDGVIRQSCYVAEAGAIELQRIIGTLAILN